MPERELKKKQPAKTRQDEEVIEDTPETSKQGEKIKAELDELLDDIDEVLEENAEDFVRNYVQKGGE